MTTRQHSQTTVSELIGRRCENLFGVPLQEPDQLAILYLQIERTWHRVFLDADVLFVDECNGPDPEDDLEEDQEYRDLAMEWGLTGDTVVDFSFQDGVLSLKFGSGVTLTLREDTTGAMKLQTDKHVARS